MWTYSEEQLAPLVPSGEQNRAMAWAYAVRGRANPELSERRERGRGRRHTLWGIMHRGFYRVDRKGRRCGHTRRDSISKTFGRWGQRLGRGTARQGDMRLRGARTSGESQRNINEEAPGHPIPTLSEISIENGISLSGQRAPFQRAKLPPKSPSSFL